MHKTLVLAAALVLAACSQSFYDVRQEVGVLKADNGVGSGVVIAPGLVLTAKHVVEIGGLQFRGGSIKGVVLAEADDADLGLLYYPRGEGAAVCPCAKLASYDALVDEPVYVIGYPYGIAQVVTVGISQGVQSNVTVPGDPWNLTEAKLGRRLVVTAGAAPGNSGGGVYVKRRGEFRLVGIVIEVVSGYGASLTLAVPISEIKTFLAQHT